MKKIKIRQFCSIFFTSFLFILTGCGGGNTNSDTATNLKVSHTAATPGTFITLQDDFIESEKILDVTFYNSSGFSVVVNAPLTETGSARVSLPPYINTENGNIESGAVTISIPNGKKAIIEIEPLPELTNVEPGHIVKIYLEYLLDNFIDASAGLAALDSEYEFGLDDLRSQIDIQANMVSQYLDEMNASGRLAVDSMQSGVITLSDSDLIQMDQLLFAAFEAMADEVNLVAGLSVASRLAGGAHLRSAQRTETQFENYMNIIKAIQELDSLVYGGEAYGKTIRKSLTGISTLTSFQKSLVENKSGLGSEEFNSGFDKVDVASRLVLTGLLSDLLKKMGKDKYGDPSRFFGDTQDVIVDILNDALGASGSPVDANTIIALLNGRTNIDKELYRRLCETGSITYEFLDYCAYKKQYQDKTVYPAVSFINIEKQTVIVGEKARLLVSIAGVHAIAKYSKRNQVAIDWGDNESLSEVWGGPYEEDRTPTGLGRFEHSYGLDLSSGKGCSFTDNQDYECIITVTVVGLDEPFVNFPHSMKKAIIITDAIKPLSLAILEEPANDLEIDQPGDWKIQVSGGYPPYKLDADWGDLNKSSKAGYPQRFRLKAVHSYKIAGLHEVTFSVTDDNGNLVSRRTYIGVNSEGGSPVNLPEVSVAATDSSASEDGDEGKFTITRTGDTRNSLTIKFALSGDATTGSDYETIGTSSIIPPGSDSIDVVIKALADSNTEGTENVILTLLESQDYTLSASYSSNISIVDIAPVKSEPNWENGCVDDNSQNAGGALAHWSMGDNPPYNGRGLICSDRDLDFWLDHNSVSGPKYLLVEEVNMGEAHPVLDRCFLQPRVTLASGVVIGGGWICNIL